MEIKDVILDIERISNLIEIGNVGGRDMGQVDCVKELEKVSNFDDFLSIIKTLTRLRNVAGDIELIQQTVKKKEFLVSTNNASQTENITREIISLVINDSTISVARGFYKTIIDVPSILPYRIIITHDLGVVRGMKFDGIYADISLNADVLIKLKELCPQIKIKYYGMEDFIQRKIFEEKNKKCLNFSEALNYLKKGYKLAREGWKNPDIWLEVQQPNSKNEMTIPYIYMVKYHNKFPCDLSCESLFANDWFVVE